MHCGKKCVQLYTRVFAYTTPTNVFFYFVEIQENIFKTEAVTTMRLFYSKCFNVKLL